MAEVIRLRVACHACGYEIEGSAKYGKGHYVAEGVPFDFVAVGKLESGSNKRVKGEVTATCPNCTVKNQYPI